MSVGLLIVDDRQPARLLPWAARFAVAQRTGVKIIVPARGKGTPDWENVQPSDADPTDIELAIWRQVDANLRLKWFHEANDSDDKESTATFVSVTRVRSPSPGWSIAENIGELDVKLLIIPAPELGKRSTESDWEHTIYRTAPCDVMFLSDDEHQPTDSLRVLVVLTGGNDDDVALRHAASLINAETDTATAIYFEPDIDEYAQDVGRRIAKRIVKKALGARETGIDVQCRLAAGIADGMKSVDPHAYDVVIVGTRWQHTIRHCWAIRDEHTERDRETDLAALIAVRAGIPFSGRLIALIQHAVRRFVPQLSRDARIELAERVQSSSAWDFDFGALMFLSTLIAALGLIRDSGAVVIGAMLVAPLMTPIVGIGLGLAQNNVRLSKQAARTVWRGFSTAFALAMAVGLISWFVDLPAAHQPFPAEMRDRGSPVFLDFVIALASGMAAAYALGRPNLLSALPGVAIAAALVPPIATSGMALTMWNPPLAAGSLLLFVSNFVAICLGTSFTFWAVGVRARHEEQSRRVPHWVLWTVGLLIINTIALIVAMRLRENSGF